MTKRDAYIWWSGATDVTGQKLAKELGIDGGKGKPKGKEIVICWGTKTKEATSFPAGTKVINHPDKIMANRNKFTTLQTLGATKGVVASFVSANQVMVALDDKRSPINLPLVGRSNFHQGGKHFHICLTKTHIKDAIEEGAQYFQTYIDIKDEYRLHVFDGAVIYAQKKVKRGNVEGAYIEQHAEKINNIAEKNERKLDKSTLDYALGRLAKEHSKVDMIVRSNRRGWKFSHVKTLGKGIGMEKLSIDAVKAIGLNFGAVDCCVDNDGKPWIIEINSGPGLDGSTLKIYIDILKAKLQSIMTPPKPKPQPAVHHTITARTERKATETGGVRPRSKLRSNSAKERLGGMRELLDLIEDADEAEATAVESLIRKRFGAT